MSVNEIISKIFRKFCPNIFVFKYFFSVNLSLKMREFALRIVFAINVAINKMNDNNIKNSSISMGS